MTNKDRNYKHINMKKTVLSLLLICAIPVLWVQAQEHSSLRNTVAITDMRGRSVILPETIEKIVALGAGSLRLVSYLDATNRVIAVEDSGHGREKTINDFYPLATYRLAYPELRNLPSIGSAENHEGIIAMDPDIIISSTVDVSQLDQLQTILNIPVFAVDVDVELENTDLFYGQLRTLGKVLGKEPRAEELITGINAILQDLKARASLAKNPKRAYAGGMMWFGPADLLRTTGDYLPFNLTGTENAMPTNPAKNLQPYMTSLEDLIAAAPDYVFIDAANVNLSRSGFEKNRKVLQEQVPAFRKQEVYTTFVYKYYGTNWEQQLINVFYIGKVLYPELFEDISIEKTAEEIWKLFFSIPLDYSTVVEQQKAGPGRADWF